MASTEARKAGGKERVCGLGSLKGQCWEEPESGDFERC